jgi:Ca2+-binding RTX toxin-like protein
VIVGGRGRDQIHRLGGDDVICGERARDILTGGSGGDGIDTARADCDTVSNVP